MKSPLVKEHGMSLVWFFMKFFPDYLALRYGKVSPGISF